ncbi:BON domain protein [Novipirellula aureliae]|uniref:BON domain protein n=1 Tax=Novipirellula aureliae TaxID=2527966 RepID=A0A5C6DZK2_9BACT|nr:BON domain-containing protein [Novipirellula aureliae]TWU41207.1 BON domain protein [Novipirellula aureliae]
MMIRRIFTSCLFAALLSSPLFAQGNADTSDQGGTLTPASGGLDADAAFSAIDRGTAVGQTAETGLGFGGVGGTTTTGTTARTTGGVSMGGMGGMGGFSSMFGNQTGQTGSSTPPVIRTRLRSAIEVPPRPQWQTEQSATALIRSLPSGKRMPGVQVRVEGRTAVIAGTVSSQHDRRMSELLMRLEPGVRNVDNQIEVLP